MRIRSVRLRKAPAQRERSGHSSEQCARHLLFTTTGRLEHPGLVERLRAMRIHGMPE